MKCPSFFRDALNARGLMDAYRPRLRYQQNDYIGLLRVTRAKLESTRQKRLKSNAVRLGEGWRVHENEMEWIGRIVNSPCLCGKIGE